MFRFAFRFLLLLVLFAFVRYAIAAVARAFRETMRQQPSTPDAQAPKGSLGGELKQDPVCGMFIPVASSVKKTVNGQLLHFCSSDCRDKFRVA